MKEILVLVDTSTERQQRIEIAMQYARHFAGHVTGLFIKPETRLPQYIEEDAFYEFNRQYTHDYSVRTEEIEAQFPASSVKLGDDADWITEHGQLDEILMDYARRSDFVMLEQHNPNASVDPTSLDKPDNIILYSGRPVIVIPYVKCSTAFPQHIMVAWDGSREAARALYDALPFLKRANTVELCTVEEAKNSAKNQGRINTGIDNMVMQLKRHGITAEAHRLSHGNLSVSNTLLNHIVDSGADMLVSGAYSHNRLKEVVLGGVTRDLLAHCSIPLLMSK